MLFLAVWGCAWLCVAVWGFVGLCGFFGVAWGLVGFRWGFPFCRPVAISIFVGPMCYIPGHHVGISSFTDIRAAGILNFGPAESPEERKGKYRMAKVGRIANNYPDFTVTQDRDTFGVATFRPSICP